MTKDSFSREKTVAYGVLGLVLLRYRWSNLGTEAFSTINYDGFTRQVQQRRP